MLNYKSLLTISFVTAMLFLFSGCGADDNGISLKAQTEADIFAQNIEVSGKIINAPIQAGQPIKKGDIIAVLDDTDQVYLIEQLQAGVAKKQALLRGLNAGNTSQEINEAQNEVESAKSSYAIAEQNYNSAKKDYDEEIALITVNAKKEDEDYVEDLKTAYDIRKQELAIAQAAINKAKEKLDLLQSGATSDDIAYAQADLSESLSKLSQAKNNLSKFKLYANCDGTVVSKNYLLDDVVASGYNLAEIANTEQIYVIAYVPEEYINKIQYGSLVTIKTKTEKYEGTVSYIALKAEYTPEDLQSSANKNKQNIKIKVKLAKGVNLLPAEPVELYLPFNQNK